MTRKREWFRGNLLKGFFMLGLTCLLSLFFVVFAGASTNDAAGGLEAESVEVWQDTVRHINPLYEDTETISILQQPRYAAETSSSVYYTSLADAAESVREQLREREQTVVVRYQVASGAYDRSLANLIFSEAIAHTGVPTEGDYLRYQYGGWTCGISISDNGTTCKLTFSYAMTYYTTADEEEEVDAKVQEVISSLALDGKNEYGKIKSIYDYICEHVVYDYEHLSDTSYKTQFTAYGALIDGTSVCQGYAVLFYRLALEAGIDARVIIGESYGEGHAWNIVRIGEKYYYLDSTWDAGNTFYRYFLKGTSDFTAHDNDAEYSTDDFFQQYPVSASAYVKSDSDDIMHTPVLQGYKDSTCTEEGYTGDTVCSECGELLKKGESIMMKDHEWDSDYTIDQPAACTVAGSKSIHCSICDAVKEGTEQSIAATGHSWGTGKVTAAATCTEAGTKTYTCSSCNASRTESIAATGHSWNADYTIDQSAACTVAGSKSIHCSICDTVKEGTEQSIAATGHSWGTGKVTAAATCTEAGTKTYTCSSCNAARTESIAATGHTYGAWAVVEAATTRQEGREERICDTCEHVDVRVIPKKILTMFTDVKTSDWYYDAVTYVYENGLMTGLNTTTFGPGEALSRAQFAVILHRMNGTPEAVHAANFPDVADNTWYTDAVLWANSIGVVNGYSDTGKFGPGDNITREQMALMMYRYANHMGYDTSVKADFGKFKDAARVSSFAAEAMKWAVGNGIITGKNNGTTIDPQGNAARAECATIIMRFMEKYGN